MAEKDKGQIKPVGNVPAVTARLTSSEVFLREKEIRVELERILGLLGNLVDWELGRFTDEDIALGKSSGSTSFAGRLPYEFGIGPFRSSEGVRSLPYIKQVFPDGSETTCLFGSYENGSGASRFRIEVISSTGRANFPKGAQAWRIVDSRGAAVELGAEKTWSVISLSWGGERLTGIKFRVFSPLSAAEPRVLLLGNLSDGGLYYPKAGSGGQGVVGQKSGLVIAGVSGEGSSVLKAMLADLIFYGERTAISYQRMLHQVREQVHRDSALAPRRSVLGRLE